jgi:hypothetical protein
MSTRESVPISSGLKLQRPELVGSRNDGCAITNCLLLTAYCQLKAWRGSNNKEMKFRRLYYTYLYIFSFSILSLHAQNTINITEFTNPIRIDGYLNETEWKKAKKIKDFFSYSPVDGLIAKEITAALFGYDKNALYVAFICYDPSPESIRASVTSRDNILNDDNIILFLDTFNTGKESYAFGFNPYGIQTDGMYSRWRFIDTKQDYIFYSEGRKFKKGYIIEAKIPFKSLRFSTEQNMTWGLSIMRNIKHLDKAIIWPAISREKTLFIPQFGKLYGFTGINTSKNIEILPEFTSLQGGSLNETEDTFKEGAVKHEAGANLKFGLTSNFTMDITYNPDFSQTEADADKIDVNRRFPLSYSEKRPFFLEGTNIFDTPIKAVYTRRIVDPLFGLKLTGKIGGTSIGILSSVDEYYGSEEHLSALAPSESLSDSTNFLHKYHNEPSYHSIIRLKQDLGRYSSIGLVITDKEFKDTSAAPTV